MAMEARKTIHLYYDGGAAGNNLASNSASAAWGVVTDNCGIERLVLFNTIND
jgi:ribonuclease HI